MTHPIYSQSALSALSLADIKAIANSIGAICDGDKRSKPVWIDAIVSHQIMFAPAKIEAMETHIKAVMSRSNDLANEEEIEWEIAQEMGKEGFYDLPDVELDEIEPESGDIFGGYGDVDESDYPDMPSHAEQEAIAHAADLSLSTASEELCREMFTVNESAVTVVLSAIVLLIVAVRSLLVGGCAIVRGAILLASMFGSYNPDLDFWWQFQQRAKSKPVWV